MDDSRNARPRLCGLPLLALCALATSCRGWDSVSAEAPGAIDPSVTATRIDTNKSATVLRWRWRAGDEHRHVVHEEFQGVIESAGVDIETERALGVESTWRVEEVSFDGVARIVQRIERVFVEGRAGDESVSFDTSRPLPPPALDDEVALAAAAWKRAQGLDPESWARALIGDEARLAIDSLGRVVSVELPARVTDLSPEESVRLPRMLTADGWRQGLEQFVELPEGLVGEGETWSVKSRWQYAFGEPEVVTTATYRGPFLREGRELALIDVTKSLVANEMTNGSVAVRFDDNEIRGEYWFDPALGLPALYLQRESRRMWLRLGQRESTQRIARTLRVEMARR